MYSLQFLSSAKKEFQKLDKPTQKIIKEKLILLVKNPLLFKNKIKPLKGEHKGKFRLRVHQYRVVFKIEDNQMFIIVIKIAHRKEVYE